MVSYDFLHKFLHAFGRMSSEMRSTLYLDYLASSRVGHRKRGNCVYEEVLTLIHKKKYAKNVGFLFFFLSQLNLTPESLFYVVLISFFIKFLYFSPNFTLLCSIMLQEHYFMSRMWKAQAPLSVHANVVLFVALQTVLLPYILKP